MNLSQLGERKIIKIFEKNFKRNCKSKNIVVGIGDDACVLELDRKNYLAVSTDLLSRAIHFPREMTPRQIGKYAVNANLSDMAAMGAEPLGLLFSFGLPKNLEEEFVEELAKGINEACREHGTCILGGDTKEHEEFLVVGTALGKVRRERLLTRAGAGAGDLICVTGSMGSAAAGFYISVKNLKVEKKISERFVKAAFEPKARVKEGLIISKYANACMDVSDGIAFTLHAIAEASKKGFLVDEAKIPIDKDLRLISSLAGEPLRELALYKGGEYELLFTINPEKFAGMKREMRKVGTKVTVVGGIVSRSTRRKTHALANAIDARGYDSFTRKM